MNDKTEEVRPEEGTQKTDPRQGKARKVLSWLKSCESEETLTTLNINHSESELKRVIAICDMLKEKANIALDNVVERELETALKEQKDAETNLEKAKKKVDEYKARVEAKRRSAEQQ